MTDTTQLTRAQLRYLKRPSADSQSGKMWAVFDKMPEATMEEIIEKCAAEGLTNVKTIRAQRTVWRKHIAHVEAE